MPAPAPKPLPTQEEHRAKRGETREAARLTEKIPNRRVEIIGS
jgi:hypothetical protein